MATLVLTAVGTAVGGPIGGAIGAMIGQQADAALFAPKSRHGPRLGELAVQTSSYGTQIPKIFGTMRVAGTVIWSTDLQERRSTSGGKGRPKSVNYTYSASFAVALSGRPVKAVRRIWADGKLLRGLAGDFKSRTKFRLYMGGEDQPVDPLIASVEGIGSTPGFRGTAYALFENFELADYGNRIPSLTFELVAEEGPVSMGAIAEDISDGAVADGGTVALGGYAAAGDSVRGAIEALSDVVPLSLIDDKGRLKIGLAAAGEPPVVAERDCGARVGESGGRSEVVRLSAAAVAGEVSVAYHDVARDYQTGMQRATRGAPSLRCDRRALPAALQADAAKAIAEYRLGCLWAGRGTAKVHLAWRGSSSRPGMQVRLEGQAGLWKVERWTLDRMVVTLQLAGVPSSALLPAAASPGRPIGQFDQPIGPTSLMLFDLPSLTDEIPDRPRLFAMAAGAGAGWRRAEMEASYDGGMSWSEAGATAGPAIIGKALSALPAAGAALIDARHSLEVELLNDGMWLEGRNNAALVAGANLAVLGDELMQFGVVEALGSRRFRLSRLLRGRRGTEWAASLHAIGEPFALIEAENLAVLEPPTAMLGGQAKLLAHGIADAPQGASAERPIVGEAIRPPSPVHLRAQRLPGGDISIGWVRRSRSGWAWLGGSDTPLGEERETYTVELSGAGFRRSATTEQPNHLYSTAAQAADGATGELTISVVQLGTSAASRPAQIII